MKVFISYAREDSDIAGRLYQNLKTHSIQPFLDTSDIDPGSNWEDTIKGQIEGCAYFLALFSDVAKKKAYVQREWSWALEKDCRVIPVRIEESSIPTELAHLQWIDIHADYQSGARELLIELHRAAKECHFEETFSSLGADNDGWTFGAWRLEELDHTGDGGQSLYGEAKASFNTDSKTATLEVNVGGATTLSYYRKYELSGANISAEVAFTVLIEAGGREVVEEHRETLGSQQSEWKVNTFDLSGYAGKDAKLIFQVHAKDSMSVMSNAKAWIDDIRLV